MTDSFNVQKYGEILAQHRPTVISSEAEYDEAIALAEKLEFSEERTPEQDSFLDLLVVLISNYENEPYPIPDAEPIEVLHHLMDAQNLKQEDLVGIIGSRGVVSEVMNEKRSISKVQAKALAEFFWCRCRLFYLSLIRLCIKECGLIRRSLLIE